MEIEVWHNKISFQRSRNIFVENCSLNESRERSKGDYDDDDDDDVCKTEKLHLRLQGIKWGLFFLLSSLV